MTEKHHSIYVNIVIVVLFISLMAMFISRFNQTEPNINDLILIRLGKDFASSASRVRYQWLAEGKPEMLMLIHYNDEDREIDRTVVRVGFNGRPLVEPSSEGCEKLWQALLPDPMRIEGFKVHGDYYKGSLTDNTQVNAYCRYGLSRGTFFDYYVHRGEVVFEGE